MSKETKLERIQKFHPDIINNFFEVGESSAIPKAVQNYLYQISWAAEIYQTERSLNFCATELKKRILAIQGIKLSVQQCRYRIYDALNYFNVDCNVSQNVWDMDTANKLEELAKMATVARDFKTAGKLRIEANSYKQRASSAQTTGAKTINFLLDPGLKAEDLGFINKSRKEIAKKANDGFYVELISGLPLDKDDKKKLFSDAELTNYEDIE